jgi:prophage maintenance system killer protein
MTTTFLLKNMKLFSALGFRWNRSVVPAVVPTHSVERVAFRFHRMLPEFVWDASVLDGVTIGGRKISDQEQVLNLATSSKHLLALVKAGKFSLDKATFTELHGLVARNEALEWGHFRGEGLEASYTPDVGLGEHGRYTPLATVAGAPELNRVFDSGLQVLQSEVQQPFEKAAAFFLFGALQKFFFDGNKRTSRFMMNGILMSAGIDAISVPAAKTQEFNERMVRFYLERDATEMMAFLIDCHPDAEKIHELDAACRTAFVQYIVAEQEHRDPCYRMSIKAHRRGKQYGFDHPGLQIKWVDYRAGWLSGRASSQSA